MSARHQVSLQHQILCPIMLHSMAVALNSMRKFLMSLCVGQKGSALSTLPSPCVGQMKLCCSTYFLCKVFRVCDGNFTSRDLEASSPMLTACALATYCCAPVSPHYSQIHANIPPHSRSHCPDKAHINHLKDICLPAKSTVNKLCRCPQRRN